MNNQLRWILVMITFVTLSFGLEACNSTNTPVQTDRIPQVEIGTLKSDILSQLGKPDEARVIIKQAEYIWGPEEEWWHTLEMSDQVEIWAYEFPSGNLQLYFLRGSDTVDRTAFVDKDIVY